MQYYVIDRSASNRVPVEIVSATEDDLQNTVHWQTRWTTKYARTLPNKVACKRTDNHELLGLMSYQVDHHMLAVEVIYLENAAHSNANLLHEKSLAKKYDGIAKALFAYAIQVSRLAGFDGVLVFKAKTTELLDYYIREFGARQAGAYDPFRLILWEEAAQNILNSYKEET